MAEKVFGDYLLIKKIGQGSFGDVYIAEHRFIKKKYALKILDEELTSDPNFIKQFEKDVSVLVALEHPSIVKVHNISSAEGKFFLVMDLISQSSGEITNLGDYLSIRGRVLVEAEVEMILRQVASALDYAHSILLDGKPLLHRSLKLSNILVDPSEKGLRVYLTDFAMIRLLGEGKVLNRRYHKFLKLFSSQQMDDKDFILNNDFAFLAPEQKDRSYEDVDVYTDIYAFGVLAYFLIAREFPEGYFDLPSTIAPEYKLNWDLFICKCLQKDPKKRPEKLTEALNSLLSKNVSDLSSLDVLSWKEVEKKVENAMQMSFEFSSNDVGIIDSDSDEIMSSTSSEIEEERDNGRPKPVINPGEIERPVYEPDPGAIFHKELQVSYYQPKKVEVKELEPILNEMIVIKEGTFYRGSNEGARDEMPRHNITLSNFALDIHPITNEQFVLFLQSMGGEKDRNNNDIIRLKDSRIKKSAGKFVIESGYSKHPVVGVTWYGAAAYAKWVGKRLPTEAEWEVAAKGGSEDLYPFGNNIDHTKANFFSSDTTAVMSYPPNKYGLYDIAGNVYEWCEDWYAYNYYDTSQQEPDNPRGPKQGVYRVLRGGCWKSLKEDLRCSHRHRNNPGAVNGTYGFRCAADVK